MTMWQVSPVAFGPTIRLVETTFPVKGALFLYTLRGTLDWSQCGSASRKSCAFFDFLKSNSFNANTIKTERAITPPVLPARVMAVIIHPAETTPAKIADRATGVGIPNKKAPMAPVQAPVPGRGIPTKAARETHCFLTSPTPNPDAFFSARFKMGLISFFNVSFFKRKRSGTMGTMLPRTQIGKTCSMGKPIQTPTGIAPRSSTTGIAEIILSTAHLGSPKLMKKLAIFCPVCKCSTGAATAVLAAKAGLFDKNVKATRATADRLRTFDTTARLLCEVFFAAIESSLVICLPKALPMGENDRFRLVLVVAGEVLGRPFVDERNPIVDLVVAWNANDELQSAATSTKRQNAIRLDVLPIIILISVRTCSVLRRSEFDPNGILRYFTQDSVLEVMNAHWNDYDVDLMCR
mmetsp:Transcript_23743/g.65872  ORF Transcript_23743/g.65872 Transcript_23743/m.65872 type:complete len:407 (+) Transcript_23743:1107-2327(+)